MKTTTAFAFLSLALCCASAADADTFGSGADTFDIEFVTIGNPGNADDTTGAPNPAGKVDDTYRIGKFAISEDMINKANTLGGLGITHDNWGANKPTTSISWFEAAKFVNWLNGSTPAYKFVVGNFQLWDSGDAGYDPNNLYRNSLATYFLPSMDEWYKAAYYDPTGSVYYDYPTGSDSVPDGIDFAGDTTFDAVFDDGGFNLQPNDITDVGVLSPYGTAGQGGNAWEWVETEIDLVNDSTSSARGFRGSWWYGLSNNLLASNLLGSVPSLESFTIGFRVASIPETDGDFDNNGIVDGLDFLKWQRGESPNPLSQSDLALWESQYGGPPPLSAVSAVPEPTTSALALAALCLAISRRRSPKS